MHTMISPHPFSSTLCKRGNGVSWFEFALQVAMLGFGRDLISQLTVVCVRVNGEELLLGDQVSCL